MSNGKHGEISLALSRAPATEAHESKQLKFKQGKTHETATAGQIMATADGRQFKRLGRDDPPGKRKAASAKGGSSELVVRPVCITPAPDARQQHVEIVTAAFALIADVEIDRVQAYINAGEVL